VSVLVRYVLEQFTVVIRDVVGCALHWVLTQTNPHLSRRFGTLSFCGAQLYVVVKNELMHFEDPLSLLCSFGKTQMIVEHVTLVIFS
jgi:hypothetical protein